MFNFSDKDLLPMATAEDVRRYVNSYDMFTYYIGSFTVGKPFLSPIEAEKEPSFSLFEKNGELLFNDFRFGGGDIISFVKLKFNMSYREAVNKIVHDAGLSSKFNTDLTYTPKEVVKHNVVIKAHKTSLNVKRRKWAQYDLDFWSTFGIGKITLAKYRISPISHVFVDRKAYKADKLGYVFKEFKDSKTSLTVYQPLSKRKWFKSHDKSVLYGWSQLPETGDVLIMTKSMKDVMTIDSITGLPTVALQNEKIFPKGKIMDELKGRFKKIYLFYDNDWNKSTNYGREFGKAISEEFSIPQIEIPDVIAEMYDAKDVSDLAKNAGEDYVKLMLLNGIEEYLV